MCGIVSILSPGGVDDRALARAVDALRHRGPDGRGVWVSADRRVGLGHARLSVIDLETGAQPLAGEDEQVHLVVNGEFYGFEDLRRGLEARGHSFRTGSDSEIALHLYEEHGVDCLRHLRGEFALVLWDARRRVLFAARDRFGIKPLCYALAGDTLYLASEAKALFAAGLQPAWDPDSFFHAASLQYVPPGRTLFRGVSQLRPGHYLLAAEGRVETFRYWDLDYPPDAERPPVADEAQYAEALRERLDEGVRVRLRADVPVCFHLSGGLDSTSVVALASRHVRGPVHCFTVQFDEGPYDELELARQAAGQLGAVLHPVRVRQDDLVAHLSDAVYFSEGLAINGHLTAKYLLARAVRDAGFKVVLGGEGSDEVLAGYPHLRRDLWLAEQGADGAASSLAELYAGNAIMAGIQLAHGEGLPLDAVERGLGFVPSFLEAKATFGLRMRGVLADDFVRQFAGRDCYAELLEGMDVSGQLAGRHRVDQSAYLWTKLSLANYILRTLGDGTEMAFGVEGRLPFLDHPFVEFATSLPVSLKIKGKVEKYLLRRAVRHLVPEAVLRRQKHAFTAPPLARFGTPAADDFLRQTLRSRAFASVPFFDRGKLLALLDSLGNMGPQERAVFDPVLMTALTAGLLHQRFGL
jgi:asparagine synthase (glutamine-hydrolysing)